MKKLILIFTLLLSSLNVSANTSDIGSRLDFMRGSIGRRDRKKAAI